MSPPIAEGNLEFEFPKEWKATKFDQWVFYRNKFLKIGEAKVLCKHCGKSLKCPQCKYEKSAGSKGIDILAISNDSVCWSIEVKDYGLQHETSFLFLADVVALKVRDTLACLFAARLNANDEDEKERASEAISCNRIRVVLHLETPPTRSSLHSQAKQRADVRQRLKQLIKAVDPDPLVVCKNDKVPWKVTQVNTP